MKKHRFPHQCRNIHSFASHPSLAAVLVAISIPIFTSQLEKARESTDAANVRDMYAEISVGLLDGTLEDDGDTMTVTGGYTATLDGDPDIAGVTVSSELIFF